MREGKMTLQAAVAYLQPIADSAVVGHYREALDTVMRTAQVVPQPNREALTQEERHELVDAAVKEMTRNFTNETAAWNGWNNLNTSPAFIAAFQYFHPTSPAPLTIDREALAEAIASISEHDPDTHDFISPEKAADAVISHLSVPVEGEVEWEYRCKLQSTIPNIEHEWVLVSKEHSCGGKRERRRSAGPWIEVQP